MDSSMRSRKLTCGSPAVPNPSLESACFRLVAETRQAKLGVAVALLVEPTVRAHLLQFESVHGDRVVGTTLDAQRAAGAALFVQDHGRALAPAVGIDKLRQRAL